MSSVVILVLVYVGITVSQETNKPDVADMIADCRTICGDTFYNCLIFDCQSDSVLCDKRCTVSFRDCYSGCETFRLDKEPSTSFTENEEPYKSNDEWNDDKLLNSRKQVYKPIVIDEMDVFNYCLSIKGGAWSQFWLTIL